MTDEEVNIMLEDMLSDPQSYLNKLLLLQGDLENARKYIKQQNKYIEALEHDVNHFKEKSDEMVVWVSNAEQAAVELKDELDHIRKQIKETLDLIGDRYDEPGRVMMALKMLEGLFDEEEEE